MGATEKVIVESRQLRRRLQRKYLAKRLMRRRQIANTQQSYVVYAQKPHRQPP